ncbi:MAG: glycosyltransferase family 39 protein [Pyrinomonadaceae bacterium]
MSASASTITTAGLTPELFPEGVVRASHRARLAAALVLIVLVGFGFRVFHTGAEGLSEDELNKVRAVEDYRAHGLSSANGEHPFLMKALLTTSVVAIDYWNATAFAQSHAGLQVSTEAAVRLPGALLGSLTSLLIYITASELFGAEVGIIAAALWALDPVAIGFNRIAKEDTFLVFFFLLANVFWLRGQRVAEEGRRRAEPFYWAAAACFGAMLASKYVPHFIAISAAYYYVFQGVKATRWRLGKRKWLIFFAVMGAAFLVCNPTILLPGTWHEMRIFAGENRIGHDGYEFMGQLYRNQMTLWLRGSPWYFYYVFMGVKLPLAVVIAFVAGLAALFMKRLGDGRYFILFWFFFWFFPFTVMGGKFTRYFTFVLPAVLITAAIGVHASARLLSHTFSTFKLDGHNKFYVRAALALVVLCFSAYASASASPHYRLYTNALGGGMTGAGNFFPHDEFYDSSMRETLAVVAGQAVPNARVASETPELVSYYAHLSGRDDLAPISLSERAALSRMTEGDVILLARGRRYFSNDALTQKFKSEGHPAAVLALGEVEAVQIYVLDKQNLELLSSVVKQ